MKKLIIALALLLLMSLPAAAADLYNIGDVLFTDSYSLLSATTTTGATSSAVTFSRRGDQFGAVIIKNIPISQHAFTSVVSVGTYSTVVWEIECSEDLTNYPTGSSNSCAYVTQSSSPLVIHIDKPGIRGVKAKYLGCTNCTVDTTLTVTGTSGGQ